MEGIRWGAHESGVREYPVDWLEVREGDWFLVNGVKFELLKVSEHVVNIREKGGFTLIVFKHDLRDLGLKAFRDVRRAEG